MSDEVDYECIGPERSTLGLADGSNGQAGSIGYTP